MTTNSSHYSRLLKNVTFCITAPTHHCVSTRMAMKRTDTEEVIQGWNLAGNVFVVTLNLRSYF